MKPVMTDTQVARWHRIRAKGRTRVLIEQFLTWAVGVGMGAPTLRAGIRGGVEAARTYWTGEAAVSHLRLALLFGAVMTYFFGVLSWNRMERLSREA